MYYIYSVKKITTKNVICKVYQLLQTNISLRPNCYNIALLIEGSTCWRRGYGQLETLRDKSGRLGTAKARDSYGQLWTAIAGCFLWVVL